MTASAERVFIWSGGAVFVGALAYGAWSYEATWAARRPFEPTALAWNAFLVALFATHHSLFARPAVKDRMTRLVASRLIRTVYVWIASALFTLVCAAWRPVGGQLYDASSWAAVVHAVVQVAGLGIIARAVATIDPLELAGIRTGSSGETLQITGPYRWVRHPIYFGWVLATFGAARMTGDRLAFAGMSLIYLVVAVPWEERWLRASFGAPYAAYQQRVRWRIVPYVY